MKRSWVLLLLISVGLNIGLGARLMRLGHPMAVPEAGRTENSGRGGGHKGGAWERPAPGDTTGWQRFMGRRVDHLAERLEMSPEQVATFREAQVSTGRLVRQRRRQLAATRARVRELVTAQVINRESVTRAMAQMSRQQAEMDSLVAETLLNELEILEPGQRALYLDFLPGGEGQRPGRGRRGRDLLGR